MGNEEKILRSIELIKEIGYRTDSISAVKHLPAQEGRYRDYPDGVHPALVQIASRAGDHLKVNNRSPMNTSRTKIIDNAVIGYVWGKLKVVPDDEAAD